MNGSEKQAQQRRRRTDIRRRLGGLTIVECVISLVIAATLLTATGMAFSASCKAMQYNDQFFRATQAARVSLGRIMAQVRLGAVDEKSTYNNLHLITATGQDVTYKLVPTTDADTAPAKLMMTVTAASGAQTQYELARNVTTPISAPTATTSGLPFNVQLGKDSNNADCVTCVGATFSVKVGLNEVRLSGSAAPRRNVTY